MFHESSLLANRPFYLYLIVMKLPALFILLVLLISCGENSPTSPGIPSNLEIINNDGMFSLKASGFSGITETLSYEWMNTSDIAVADMNGRINWGIGSLTILDGIGDTVFTFDLDEKGAYLTDAGVPGSWTIRIELRNASGNIDLTVTSIQ